MNRARAAPSSASTEGSEAPRVLEGTLEGAGLRIAVVLSRFNERVGTRLLEGALSALRGRFGKAVVPGDDAYDVASLHKVLERYA